MLCAETDQDLLAVSVCRKGFFLAICIFIRVLKPNQHNPTSPCSGVQPAPAPGLASALDNAFVNLVCPV